MLLEFVCRWRAFEGALFSMVGSSGQAGGQLLKVRPVGLVYGPNGSGKSTLVNGLGLLQDLITGKLSVKEAGKGATKRFEVVFSADGRTYLYALEMALGIVVLEELVELRQEGDREVFRREDDLVRGVDADPEPDELLLIQLACEGGVEGVQDTVRWFRRLDIIREGTVFGGSESPGVNRATALAGRCQRAAKTDSVLVVDNLDQHLHPVVVSDLVDFMLHAGSGQLIATTNAVHLLNDPRLERDQIWFIEPRRDGTSDLYSLLEFHEDDKVLLGRDMMMNYLLGRCGGIPFQHDLRKIWEGEHGGPVPG